jgi:arylsulfatase A-like enzyme
MRWNCALFFAVAGSCASQPAANPHGNDVPVILISIDTLRADHLSAYGYRKLRTPNIDAFAEGGTLFQSVSSQVPLTLPSHTSLFTSTYPFANGVEENGQQVPANSVTLAATLRAQGYRTAAFVGSILLHRKLGLDRGFDVYDSPFETAVASEREGNPYSVRVRRDGALVVRAARQWLEARHGQKIFAFLHLFDLHAPYARAASPDGLPNTAGYDAELAYVDQVLGGFRQALVAGGWWDRSLIVLLSDHGESLGEHGEQSHGYFVYQSTMWVPLMIHWPRGAQNAHRPARVETPGGLIDVAPTVLEFLGIARPPSFAGRSLFAEGPVVSESVYPRDAFGWGPLRSLRTGRLQYIDAPKPEVYDLEADPQQQKNLIAARGPEAAKLKAELANLLSRYTKTPAASSAAPRTNTALESLGYAGGSPRRATGPTADPKDRLPEYNQFERALSAMYAGHIDPAIANFRKLVAQDAENTMARYYLGEAYRRSGRVDEAIREWNSAASHDPQYQPAYEALGTVWLERHDYTRARTYFLQALTLAPGDPDAARGAARAEDQLGMPEQAREHWRKACQLEPEFAECGKPSR